MAKFRKKPVVIEAFQWTGDFNQTEEPDWIVEAISLGRVWFIGAGTPKVTMVIRNPRPVGIWVAKPGEWIVLNTLGEIRPYSPRAFEAEYEPVE
jgi:hypothetical protein